MAYFSDPILQGILHQLPDVCPTSDSEITIVADPRIPFPDQKSPRKAMGREESAESLAVKRLPPSLQIWTSKVIPMCRGLEKEFLVQGGAPTNLK